MCTRIVVTVLAALCIAKVACAQDAEPLPKRLVGYYSVWTWDGVITHPVELTEIHLAEGDRVIGIVAYFRSPKSNCVSNKTPFYGTYRNGLLSIRSWDMESQFADRRRCEGLVINLKVSAGCASGTYEYDRDNGIPLEFEVK